MHKILFATSNQDKFHIVSELLKNIGLNWCEFYNLKTANLTSDLTEVGTIEDRAKQKAIEFKNCLKDYDIIIGVDDGILLPFSQNIDTQLKKVTKQIIDDKILKEGDVVKICRSFCFITKQKEYSTVTYIPFSYHEKENAEIKPNSYPLRQVLSPLNTKTSISDLSENVVMDYYVKYCKENLEIVLQKLTDI